MTAYYNEIDPFAAAWLRELIKAGLIADGDVDERSIEDVRPDDLVGYAQCHFFAGIGGWSLALRQAGWPDDKSVWTMSCPCQPFSAAGQGNGFADERHLWPSGHWLIQQCRPAIVFGEQVASKATDEWLDLVQLDVETLGYAFGCIAFPAAGIGAPHIRDRAYWVAKSQRARLQGSERGGATGTKGISSGYGAERSDISGMGHAIGAGLEGHAGHGNGSGEPGRLDAQSCGSVTQAGGNGGLADAGSERRQQITGSAPSDEAPHGCAGRHGRKQDSNNLASSAEQIHRHELASPTNGFWADADWLLCRDGKWRPVEPGTFPLANGIPNRVGKLRGYGNAIVPAQAAEFIRASML